MATPPKGGEAYESVRIYVLIGVNADIFHSSAH